MTRLVPRYCGFCGSRFLVEQTCHNEHLSIWCPTCARPAPADATDPPVKPIGTEPPKPQRKRSRKRKD